MTDLDVAIIGGGVSGLAVADGLTRAGRSAQVFEARPRLGGRVHAVAVPNGRADLGPTWFWPGEERVAQLVTSYGIPTHDQWSAGDAVFAANGEVHRIPNPQVPHSYRFSSGADALIDALVQRLSADIIRLDAPVVRVERQPDHVAVHTAGDSTTAAAAVIALPPALAIHSGMLSVDDLDPAVGQTAAAMPIWMAAVTKVVAVFADPFWRELGLSGMVSAPGHAFNEIHDMSGPDAKPAMLFGFGHGRPVTGSAPANEFVSQVTALLGAHAEPIAVHVLDWSAERFTTTASATHNTDYTLFGAPPLRRPSWDGTLFWSSTETASTAPGHIEGALAAAERTLRLLLVR